MVGIKAEMLLLTAKLIFMLSLQATYAVNCDEKCSGLNQDRRSDCFKAYMLDCNQSQSLSHPPTTSPPLSLPLPPLPELPTPPAPPQPVRSCLSSCASSLCSKLKHDKKTKKGCLDICSRTCNQVQNSTDCYCIFLCSINKCNQFLSDVLKLGLCVMECKKSCLPAMVPSSSSLP